MTVGLIARAFDGEAKVMGPDEMTTGDWFDLSNLPYPRYFPSFLVIDNFLAKKFYLPSQG